ncbi:MAG: hypothetical protein F4023_05605 [Acidobacteria bacterium]|nr:hypothetical protein [Acidobacteriota bacterium]MYA46235.1 hypothetical protein [Acidobacteriota bacterium]MYH22291.1 hypothetical protein [Acidobacteriota bacterium]MYI39884.1 hypothetical protein [Acidobacteriota bacterium]MYK79110.1 hypothetical protein [Acidobacteriota bacterium]
MQSIPDTSASQIDGSRQPGSGDWVGNSAAAVRIRGEIATAALSDDPVLVEAEDGTGRRLAAELIHRLSRGSTPGSAEDFLAIEGGGRPPEELGPHVEAVLDGPPGNGNGSGVRTLYLSGVKPNAIGRFARGAANNGAPRRFRLIASTAPPSAAGNNGRTGLPPIVIRIPPLRERKMDISALALRFFADACGHAGVGPYGISSRMIAAYHDYDWPGNVVELRAVIESAVSTAALACFRGRVLPDSFCAIAFDGDRSGRSLKEMIRDMEKSILESTLHRVGGNQAHAARILQLKTTTLHEKLKRYGMLRVFRQRDAASVGQGDVGHAPR